MVGSIRTSTPVRYLLSNDSRFNHMFGVALLRKISLIKNVSYCRYINNYIIYIGSGRLTESERLMAKNC